MFIISRASSIVYSFVSTTGERMMILTACQPRNQAASASYKNADRTPAAINLSPTATPHMVPLLRLRGRSRRTRKVDVLLTALVGLGGCSACEIAILCTK
ncbi:uncharacterized protein BDV14DRAFT_90248 [Aspergillus stella-maris]|uniref:uncharacterized protein n=1 Tax=Aspergillus stella-maris TaxID=1810926 RepID=UPI003CCE15C3